MTKPTEEQVQIALEWADHSGNDGSALCAALEVLAQALPESREKVKDLEALVAEKDKLLDEIILGKGPYSQDRLQHATDTIEAMKELAKEALSLAPEKARRIREAEQGGD